MAKQHRQRKRRIFENDPSCRPLPVAVLSVMIVKSFSNDCISLYQCIITTEKLYFLHGTMFAAGNKS